MKTIALMFALALATAGLYAADKAAPKDQAACKKAAVSCCQKSGTACCEPSASCPGPKCETACAAKHQDKACPQAKAQAKSQSGKPAQKGKLAKTR